MRYGKTSTDQKTTTPMGVPQEYACCVSWQLTRECQNHISVEQLGALHDEIGSCADLVSAHILEVTATSGVLQSCAAGSRASSADSGVRLGQLVCRWASEQRPRVLVQVGVHIGQLSRLQLPGKDFPGYFGEVLSISRALADSAPKPNCVHLLPNTKRSLVILERLPFSVITNAYALGADSYYLDPWITVIDEDEEPDPLMEDSPDAVAVKPSYASSRRLSSRMADPKCVNFGPPDTLENSKASSLVADMDVAQFAKWLTDYGVDTEKFGKGQAKSLQEFHSELVEEKKSYLVLSSGEKLERRLELVRINLCAKKPDGADHSLKLALEVMTDGRTRTRNQRLAVVVPEGVTWHDAVKQSFSERFNMTPELQDETFWLEGNWYKEERVVSPSIPGIPTTYLTHEVRMRVIDPKCPKLHVIGLPELRNFSSGGNGKKKNNWTWTAVGEDTNNADMLTQLLQDHGIPITEFAPGAFHSLLDEVYDSQSTQLVVRNGELLRCLEIIKVWLAVDILSVPHRLVTLSKLQRGQRDFKNKDRPISMRVQCGQSWEESLSHCLAQRLGLEHSYQKNKILIDQSSYRQIEEVEYSRSYPGLKSVYRIHEVTCRVTDPHPNLGLPEGNDFAFSRIDRCKDSQIDDVVVTYYTWKSVKELEMPKRMDSMRKSIADTRPTRVVDPDSKRRVPAPHPLKRPDKSSNCVVADLMKGRRTDWTRARHAAKHIRDKKYTCQLFFEDCVAAFPELALYVGIEGEDEASATTSGRSADDEFQRTIGALFAVYWLMRLHLDGGDAFSFGVGEDWLALTKFSTSPARNRGEIEKRSLFLAEVQWRLFVDVFNNAGILTAKGHDEEQTLGMLVLTAIHDIMKVQALLPVVAAKNAPYAGYKAGETITDHDIALGYVLEYMPNSLPSFAGLPKEQQEGVKFTQCNMEYNMGWLVQAEATPGALFQKFKAIINSGKANPKKIAFYFTHWLTDLAGAEPFPQEGCEKFVLKFPQRVLMSFLKSFSFVEELSTKSETQVYEEYLIWRWKSHEPALGNVPQSEGAIARLRLVVMAQGHADKVLSAFEHLPDAERQILSEELARTGCKGQSYSQDTLTDTDGPAFLVYYGPAMLQKNCGEHAAPALAALAEILRQARSLWPLQAPEANETVTLQIDILKELEAHTLNSLPAGEVWALCRTSNKTAQVKRTSLTSNDNLDMNVQRFLFFGTGVADQSQRVIQTKDSRSSVGRASTSEILGDPVVPGRPIDIPMEGNNNGYKSSHHVPLQIEADSVGAGSCCGILRKPIRHI